MQISCCFYKCAVMSNEVVRTMQCFQIQEVYCHMHSYSLHHAMKSYFVHLPQHNKNYRTNRTKHHKDMCIKKYNIVKKKEEKKKA